MTNKPEPIALLGTSADPPTYGHKALLEGLLTLFPKVATWASDNPKKNHMASLQKRHLLLNALVHAIANPHLELVQELSSPWTITTLERAAEKWPKSEFIFVVGSDLAGQIPTWMNAKSILQRARIGIAPRKGWPVEKKHLMTLRSLGGQIDLLPLSTPPTASSEIRTQHQPDQIPPEVMKQLLKHNLYGIKKTN